MSNVVLLIYPIMLLLMVFAQCEVSGHGEFAEDYWSRKQFKMLQAMACIGVVLHHITQMITSYGEINKGPVTIFSSMGILFTALFFFFSGYGLIYSYINKEGYLKTFLIHRMSLILIPFFVANAVYVLVRIFYTKIPMTHSDIVKCLLGRILINGNGWYIVEIGILYLAFYFIFRLVKNRDFAIFLLCIVTVIIIRYAYKAGHDDYFSVGNHWFRGEWWYNSSVTFIMGILVARFKDGIVSFAKKYYAFLLPAFSVMFLLGFYYEEKILSEYGYYRSNMSISKISNQFVSFTAQSILCLIFVSLILLINLKISIGNRALDFIAGISMEIFLIHGLFIRNIFNYSRVNDAMIYAIVLVCGITAAWVMHFIVEGIYKIPQLFDVYVFQTNQVETGEKKRRIKGKKASIDFSAEKVRLTDIVSKKTIINGTIALVSIIVLIIAGKKIYVEIRASIEFKRELSTLSQAEVGDVITFGRLEEDYNSPGTERVEWIVLKKDGDQIMLLSKLGLAGNVYYNRHEEVEWKDSDLCRYLNKSMYDEMFSNYERDIVIANPDSGDMLSLLSQDEAAYLFADDISRQIELTSIAENSGTNINSLSKVDYWDSKGYRSSWWWLRGDGKDITTPIVTENGEVIAGKKYVNKPNGAVRPVVWIKIQ